MKTRFRSNIFQWAYGSGIAILLTSFSLPATAQGRLENPADGGYESGISAVTGWNCDANTVEIEFQGPTNFPGGQRRFTTAYGTFRGDTEGVCGDTDNGFAFLINFNNLDDGDHTLKALADGVEFDSATFHVATFGSPFLRGIEPFSQAYDVYLYQEDKFAGLIWQESKQNFVVSESGDIPFTYTALLAKLEGVWSGTWQSRTGSGNIALQFDTVDFPGWGQLIGISEADLTATGCTGRAVYSPAIANWQSARTTVDFTDGSVAGFAFMFPAYTNETLVGDFVYLAGTCKRQYGAFVLFKQQP